MKPFSVTQVKFYTKEELDKIFEKKAVKPQEELGWSLPLAGLAIAALLGFGSKKAKEIKVSQVIAKQQEPVYEQR